VPYGVCMCCIARKIGRRHHIYMPVRNSEYYVCCWLRYSSTCFKCSSSTVAVGPTAAAVAHCLMLRQTGGRRLANVPCRVGICLRRASLLHRCSQSTILLLSTAAASMSP
jgi:hypothetical protein